MDNFKGDCFIIMPFAVDYQYFYLFIQKHIEQIHNVRCYRADNEPYLEKPIIERIRKEIQQADVILADCSGHNPNVFFELGIADAHNKKIILITRDDIKEKPLPFDIRQLEVINYQNPDVFLKKLDAALDKVFSLHYDAWQERAKSIFVEFHHDTGLQVTMKSEEDFRAILKRTEQDKQLPDIDGDDAAIASFILFSVVKETIQTGIGRQIDQWINQKHSKT
jgi:hypothetical protein